MLPLGLTTLSELLNAKLDYSPALKQRSPHTASPDGPGVKTRSRLAQGMLRPHHQPHGVRGLHRRALRHVLKLKEGMSQNSHVFLKNSLWHFLCRALAVVVLLLMPLAAIVSYQMRLRDTFDGVW